MQRLFTVFYAIRIHDSRVVSSPKEGRFLITRAKVNERLLNMQIEIIKYLIFNNY